MDRDNECVLVRILSDLRPDETITNVVRPYMRRVELRKSKGILLSWICKTCVLKHQSGAWIFRETDMT
jgi:hypothetical protein